MKTFKHSGRIGDILWSLHFIKSNGGAEVLYLNLNDDLTQDNYNYIKPLLEFQPYISGVEIHNGEIVDFDLDRFRDVMYKSHTGTLAESYYVAFGQNCDKIDLNVNSWLHVDNYKPLNCVVITRTFNLHNRDTYNQLYKALVNRNLEKTAVFVGLKEEHEHFNATYETNIPFYCVNDALDMARIVNNSSMVIGNQTSTTVISEALKKSMLLEVRLDDAKNDCLFDRPNLFYI